MIDKEPEPQYSWEMKNPYGYMIFTQGGKTYYQHPDDWVMHYDELTEGIMKSWGCVRSETVESRLVRAEWRIRQLELELERRQDWERERSERD